MPSPRLPRFERASNNPSIKLTARDHEIIRLIHRHRFLRSGHIFSLIEGSSQQIVRRLQLLFHHGFLTRPRAQLEYFIKGGSREIVYGLGNKGAKLLKDKYGISFAHVRLNEKNQTVGRIFLLHALLVSDIMVALELAARNRSGVSLVECDSLFPLKNGHAADPFRWRVRLKEHVPIGLIPDRMIALDISDEKGRTDRRYFFLEADRGTMPIVRNNLTQTSFYRKLLAYEATWTRGLHKKLFGFHRFRVLTVTTSPARAGSLVEACSKLKRGRGLFLFCDQATFKKTGDVFVAPWRTGKGDTTTLLP